MSIRLFNQGARSIFGDGFEFKPKTTMEFNDETGSYLKRLYGQELVSMDDVQKQFESADEKHARIEAKNAAAKGAAPKKSGKQPPAEPKLSPEEEELMAKLKEEQDAAAGNAA